MRWGSGPPAQGLVPGDHLGHGGDLTLNAIKERVDQAPQLPAVPGQVVLERRSGSANPYLPAAHTLVGALERLGDDRGIPAPHRIQNLLQRPSPRIGHEFAQLGPFAFLRNRLSLEATDEDVDRVDPCGIDTTS
jgi:hypothetical protein